MEAATGAAARTLARVFASSQRAITSKTLAKAAGALMTKSRPSRSG